MIRRMESNRLVRTPGFRRPCDQTGAARSGSSGERTVMPGRNERRAEA
ncbi:hypothetical protein N136_03893 [Leifsonia aquatica ATCC 14665]|uniref:Uncharacterized protein n=1 Tax=Leifsonia aquatica ATCC 14665 TaxID=1358026 RepID=U2RMH5_LEIAQ|nr:hypothetical protein N136_03893 [Leifsonia aquatica ATCC 14665]